MSHVTLNVIRDQPRKPAGKTLMFCDGLGRAVHTTRDDIAEQRHPMLAKGNPSAKPDGDPSSTTTGASGPPGLKTNLVAAYPTEGKYSFWPQVTPGGTQIMRRDMQSKSDPELAGGPFKVGPDVYHSYDQTSSHFRLWSTQRAPVEMNQYKTEKSAGDGASIIRDRLARMKARRSGSTDATGAGLGTSARTWAGGGKNNDTGEGGAGTNPLGHKVENTSEIEGVGAMSTVNGRKTGYSIVTDVARPGLVAGRGVAKQVAARVSALQQINRANALAWQKG